jgi:hypothetical protein
MLRPSVVPKSATTALISALELGWIFAFASSVLPAKHFFQNTPQSARLSGGDGEARHHQTFEKQLPFVRCKFDLSVIDITPGWHGCASTADVRIGG